MTKWAEKLLSDYVFRKFIPSFLPKINQDLYQFISIEIVLI